MYNFFIHSGIVKVASPLLAHAFILNKRGMEKILNYTEYGRQHMNCHFDKLIGSKVRTLQKYAVFPMFAFQGKNPALFQKALDKMNVQISIRSLCKWNEALSICIPFLLILMIIWLCYRYLFRRF